MTDQNQAAAIECRVGVDHIGITVPSIPEATEYLEQVFGAEVMYDLIPLEGSDEPERRREALDGLAGMDYEAYLGTPPSAEIDALRFVAIGDGPIFELFEYRVEDQRDPVAPSDLGIQHFCIYVDDVEAAASRTREAGGRVLAGPMALPGIEEGEGNLAYYTVTPWGSTIELISYPSRMAAQDLTPRLRPGWRRA